MLAVRSHAARSLHLDAHGIHGIPARQGQGCPRYPVRVTTPAPWQKQSRHGRLQNPRASGRSVCRSVRQRTSTHAGNVPRRRGSCRSRRGLSPSSLKRRTGNSAFLSAARAHEQRRRLGVLASQQRVGGSDRVWRASSLRAFLAKCVRGKSPTRRVSLYYCTLVNRPPFGFLTARIAAFEKRRHPVIGASPIQ
jgi:hypothetical protein